jgi:AAA15 family ATPase/GTPase
MSEHFIKNIEIKNFKCFEDFKAEGFGRVNLIGGKNNVGKTAFMEAVYINTSQEDLKKIFATIVFSRYLSDMFADLFLEVGRKFIDNFIEEKSKSYVNNQINSNLGDLKVNTVFKSNNKSHKQGYENFYSLIIKNELEGILDNYLKEFDNSIEKFRIINSKPYCKKDGKFYSLNEFGDGIGKFIYFIMLLLSQKNIIVLLDEIENGIHYTNLDKLWEIILIISKQQNVQVFATTHSKECIESYARVAKKLEDKEITFIELGKDDENKITSIVYEYEEIINQVEQHQDIRGW